ncbi:MAG: metallophosphoesterase family protein [Tepidiformaceae bacterium]
MLIGLIADTHGELAEDARAALEGCELILHAGDIGSGVLARLESLAPTVAVRGNNDLAGPEALLPEVAFVDAAEQRIAVVHRLVDAPAADFDILVFGHCHKRHDDSQAERRYINPGAAGRRGFHRARSVALLRIEESVICEFIDLGPRNQPR